MAVKVDPKQNNPKSLDQGWEKEWDQAFGHLGTFTYTPDEMNKLTNAALKHISMKEFIKNLLSQQKAQLLQKIREKTKSMKMKMDTYEPFGGGYNTALDDLTNILDSMEDK